MRNESYVARIKWGALIGVSVVLVGCAMPLSVSHVNQKGLMDTSALHYEVDSVRQQLASLGLEQPLTQYWHAYWNRDWEGRYRMEEFQRPVEQKFYLSYHQAAWQLLELRIEGVDATEAPERVRVSLRARFRNPERQEQERTTFLQDLWTKKNQGWAHVNSDPMLNGLRSVK